jgi:hypothetical protein
VNHTVVTGSSSRAPIRAPFHRRPRRLALPAAAAAAHRATGTPAPDVDIHSFVLNALDEHLAALLDVRARLTAARAALPGTRLRLVADGATSARRYLSGMEAVLSAVDDVVGAG